MLALNATLLLVCFLIAASAWAAAYHHLRNAQEFAVLMPRRRRDAKARVVKKRKAGAVADRADLSRQLFRAGFTHPQAAQRFIGVKLAAAVLGAALGGLLLAWAPSLEHVQPLLRLAVVLAAAIIGFATPMLIVDRRRRNYQRRIAAAVPDALDCMLICVEAGQSIDITMLRVADELAPIHPDLAARCRALTGAMAAGAGRHEAWARMAQETGSDDLRQLTTIITQSAKLGTPIAQTLRVFAADLRDQRVRQIEEKANTLPTKMTLGTMMFTVPPLLILLLSPAVYRIMTAF